MGSGSASPKPPPPPQVIDLLHAVPMRVTVSSTVANVAHSPFDLVDGDLTTAWNSRTGERNPWIAFRVQRGVHIARVELTVGFTTTGPEGDYFTMNLRIRRVRVSHDGTPIREVDLDPENRGLQAIPVDVTGGDFKIEVLDTVPGTRKTWREVCVSELRVFGTPPPGPRHDALTISIGSLDAGPVADSTLAVTALPSYATVAATCSHLLAAPETPCEKFEVDCRTPPEKPACSADVVPSTHPALPSALPAGWTSASWLGVAPGLRTTTHCHLAITSAQGVSLLEDVGPECGAYSGIDGLTETRSGVTFADGWLLVVGNTVDRGIIGESRTHITEQLYVCGTDVDGAPACTDAIKIGRLDHVEEASSEPDHDGLYVHDEMGWRLRYKVAGGVLTLEKESGTPDDDVRGMLGRHRLRR
jgi:hypothetical protein